MRTTVTVSTCLSDALRSSNCWFRRWCYTSWIFCNWWLCGEHLSIAHHKINKILLWSAYISVILIYLHFTAAFIQVISLQHTTKVPMWVAQTRELITAKCYYPALRDFNNTNVSDRAIHKSIKTQERSNDTQSGVPQEFLNQFVNFQSFVSFLFSTFTYAKKEIWRL